MLDLQNSIVCTNQNSAKFSNLLPVLDATKGALLEIGDGYELGVTMDRLFYDWLHSYLFIYCCYATYSSI